MRQRQACGARGANGGRGLLYLVVRLSMVCTRANPNEHPDSECSYRARVLEINTRHRGHGRAGRGRHGFGRHARKLADGQIAVFAGCHYICIRQGGPRASAATIEEGGRCHLVRASSTPSPAGGDPQSVDCRHLEAGRCVVVDDGAVLALNGGKSLRPGGRDARGGAIRSRR